MKRHRITVTCKCCGREWGAWASQYVFHGVAWCANCNRPIVPELTPCDHKPWRRRWRQIAAKRAA